MLDFDALCSVSGRHSMPDGTLRVVQHFMQPLEDDSCQHLNLSCVVRRGQHSGAGTSQLKFSCGQFSTIERIRAVGGLEDLLAFHLNVYSWRCTCHSAHTIDFLTIPLACRLASVVMPVVVRTCGYQVRL